MINTNFNPVNNNIINYVFNPGPTDYKKLLNSEYYVDKTELILELNKKINTEDCYICVSRPRRFGKTVTANMLAAYYSYSKTKTTIFNDKKIAKICDENKTDNNNNNKWNEYLNEFNVIKLNVIDYFSDCSVIEGIDEIKYHIVCEVEKTIKNLKYTMDKKIFHLFEEIHEKTNRQIVFIIDEWDCILREKRNKKDYKNYLKFLNSFLKDKKYIALAYMTGILPIKKYGEQLYINNFEEYSMTSPKWTTKYVGFLEKEVEELCKIQKFNKGTNNIHNSANKIKNYNKEKEQNSIEVNFDNIKKWYDGYILKDEIKKEYYNIYTPYSIVKALNFNVINNYWSKTESYFEISKYIKKNYFGLKEDIIRLRERKKIKINIKTYKNDMTSFKNKDDVFTMLVHLGYLSYNTDTKEVFIPNKEILEEFKNYTKSDIWNTVVKKLKDSRKLLKATWKCKEKKIAKLIEKYHNVADNKSYNIENALKYTVLLAYYTADEYYNSYIELDSGKWYIDIAYVPIKYNSKYPVLIIELRLGQKVNTAIKQIKKRKYPQKFKRYNKILLIGISYDKNANSSSKNFKRHTCKIEIIK
ncbi:hypothetical protein PIROE2DRAFT_17411 [Piromyces sp. E2]|nr:hypothetical protein PIROE2DRAFT_17411 [Piromyces sp. E2]|eukprot:OUM57568.1 hypothetical protein PIROE2DRAFT_17411 [Piromyces sp. E2]